MKKLKGKNRLPAILVGNKCEVDVDPQDVNFQRKVSWQEGRLLSFKMSLDNRRTVPFIETSAKYHRHPS